MIEIVPSVKRLSLCGRAMDLRTRPRLKTLDSDPVRLFFFLRLALPSASSLLCAISFISDDKDSLCRRPRLGVPCDTPSAGKGEGVCK